jgi:N-acetylglutamate synthase-like GNAT family acetyltransferase
MAETFPAGALQIIEYRADLAHHFYTINAEWIEAMFVMEPHDKEVLSYPQREIIDRGGIILFAAAHDLGIVGTCALMPSSDGEFELTKMGVLASARGRKVGEFLLSAVIDRAHDMKMKRLYLLTNHACEAAIHLYEKAGFQHDAGIMAEFGSTYARCDVAMNFPL